MAKDSKKRIVLDLADLLKLVDTDSVEVKMDGELVRVTLDVDEDDDESIDIWRKISDSASDAADDLADALDEIDDEEMEEDDEDLDDLPGEDEM